jgi:hypothetical protein
LTTFVGAMEEEDSRNRGERRSEPRIPARTLVEVRLPDWGALRSVYTVNLSLGGMRLSLGGRAPLGAAVDIILTLPNGERLHLPGIVANLGDRGDIGVRFEVLPAHTMEQISRYVDELAAGRTPSQTPATKTIPPGTLIKKTT